MRLLPQLTEENRAYWTSGETNELRIAFCDSCDHAIHPPEVICPVCLGRSVTTRPVNGTGTLYSWTINRQQWAPDMPVPFALGVVDVDGAPGVRITARLIDVDLDAIAIGDRVQVDFERIGPIWFPVFRPLAQA
ncbi:MAG: Zn-ribbon domain-containing OB-fold protein [Sphingobium sp.]